MSAPVNIKGDRTGQVAKVTRFGQLVVAPIQYSTPVTQEMDTINTAFNYIAPIQGSSIVITDIFVSADNMVSNVVPAEIEIYTAESGDTITVLNSILQPRVVRSGNVPLTGLNLLIGEGVWVNAKTNDDNVLLTIMFYRIPVGDI